jgi:hypothetical protein
MGTVDLGFPIIWICSRIYSEFQFAEAYFILNRSKKTLLIHLSGSQQPSQDVERQLQQFWERLMANSGTHSPGKWEAGDGVGEGVEAGDSGQ